MLARQATEQLAQLSTLVEAGISLDTAVEPGSEEDAVETFAPPQQIAVMRRALKAEMRRQVNVVGHSVDAIYACAAELKRSRHFWPVAKPRT